MDGPIRRDRSHPGPSLDTLLDLAQRHGPHFTSRVNVDIHSAGGWSPDFYRGAQKQLHNLYASPSILITGRVAHAGELIREIDRERLLVESDSHDARLMTRLVWAGVEWIARARGWRLECGEEEWEMLEEEEEQVGADGRAVIVPEGEVWAVRQLERNWARFMRLVD